MWLESGLCVVVESGLMWLESGWSDVVRGLVWCG